MKSQDIVLLFKLISLNQSEKALKAGEVPTRAKKALPDWQDWEVEGEQNSLDLEPHWSRHELHERFIAEQYGVRALEKSTGISRTQISLALKRCYAVGLAKPEHSTGIPRVNRKALFEFLVFGLRYVFPATAGAVTRGISTSLGAPVLEGKLMTAGELLPVWPDARGNTKGVSVEPLYKSVTYAVRQDQQLYALLALTDALRLGQARERKLAENQLYALIRK
ncbi:hypothetical protein RVM26_14215 [Halomonas sp. KM072]